MDVTIEEDELGSIIRVGRRYLVPLAQIPTTVDALRELADRLEAAYDEDDPDYDE